MAHAQLAAAQTESTEGDVVRQLEAAIEADPSSPARRDLGMVHLSNGRFLPAYARLRSWTVDHPGDHEARGAAAFAAVQLGRTAEAEELLAPLDPEVPRTALLWGDIHLRKGDAGPAITALEPLLDHPQLPDLLVRRLLAESYLLADRHADVSRLLEGRTDGQPGLALILAESRFESGEMAAAVDSLWPHRTSDLVGLHADLGRYLVLAGRFDDAVPVLERAVADQPDDRTSWESLGRALFASGRRDEAQAAVTRARELASAQTRESERQVEHHRKLRDPSKVRRSRAVALGDEGKWAEALALLEEEIQIYPDDPVLRNLAAAALLRLDREDDALLHSRHAVELSPEDPQLLTLHGAVLRRLGRLEESRATLERALDVDPDFEPARRQLALATDTDTDTDPETEP